MNPLAHETGLAVLAIVALAAVLVIGLALAGPGACW